MKIYSLFLLSFLCFDALANNAFIPNHYRNRRAMNSFSALGWSDRQEASAVLQSSLEKKKDNGVNDDRTERNLFRSSIFYKISPELNFEAALLLLKANNEDLNPSAPEDEQISHGKILGLGYQLPGSSVAMGVQYLHTRTNLKEGSTNDKSHNRNEMVSVGRRPAFRK